MYFGLTYAVQDETPLFLPDENPRPFHIADTPPGTLIHFIAIFPVDSVIHTLNNQVQKSATIVERCHTRFTL